MTMAMTTTTMKLVWVLLQLPQLTLLLLSGGGMISGAQASSSSSDSSSSANKQPKNNKQTVVKLFLMAGDSNIEGHGSLAELHNLAIPPGTTWNSNTNTNSTNHKPNAYEHLVDEADGKWIVRDDVYVSYQHHLEDGSQSQHQDSHLMGPLSAKGFGHSPTTFGPDVEFGTVLGNSLVVSANTGTTGMDKVVIVKAGWAHKTLAMDFRPPSAGTSTGTTGTGTTAGMNNGNGNVTGGPEFVRMVSAVRDTIHNLGDLFGDDDDDNNDNDYDVEICGMVWWHGYDDIILGFADEYEDNLVHLIRDIRIALEVPDLPVLVAELGGQGVVRQQDQKDGGGGGGGGGVPQNELDFRAMQQRVTSRPEFADNTKYVDTAKYVVYDDQPSTDHYTNYHGRAHTIIAVGRLMSFYMTRLAQLNRSDRDVELIEVDFEQMENNMHTQVMLFFAVAAVGFVVLVALARGRLSQASLTKAWKDTVRAITGHEKVKSRDDDEEFSIEMRELQPEENMVV